jgi:hypothetical protein
MTEITKGFNVPLKGREPLETGYRRVTFGQAAKGEKNCLLPMASSSGLQASNDAKCFHGHRDGGSPRVRGKLAQPASRRICKSDPASRRRATSDLDGSPEKRVPEDRPQPATATFKQRASGHAPRRSTCLEREPHQLWVAPIPDVSSEDLLTATGEHRSDPTSMIECPQPCKVRYTTAYSFHQPEFTKYAASWEFAGDNFNVILEYEFENQILNALGSVMTWR